MSKHTSKKRKISILLFPICGFLTIAFIFLGISMFVAPIGFPMQTLSKYFQKLPIESSETKIAVASHDIVIDGERICKSIDSLTEDKSGYANLDYFRVQDGVLYFLAGDYTAEKSGAPYAFDIYIGKLHLDSEELNYQYVGGFGERDNDDRSMSRYRQHFLLQNSKGYENSTTAIFDSGHIYVKDSKRAVKYSIEADTLDTLKTEETEKAFCFKYEFRISEDENSAMLTHLSSGETRKITLDKIAQTSAAATKILDDLSDRKVLGGGSYTDKAFRYSAIYEIEAVYLTSLIGSAVIAKGDEGIVLVRRSASLGVNRLRAVMERNSL